MKLINKNIGLGITVHDELIDTLVMLSKKHYPNEYGGFLVGYYSDNFKELIITDTILPSRFKSSRYMFERDTAGIKRQLKECYTQVPSKYYIGEWHSHPDGLPIPSTTDLNALSSIANHSDVSIKNPLLLIAGRIETKIEFGFYIIYKNKLLKYEQQD